MGERLVAGGLGEQDGARALPGAAAGDLSFARGFTPSCSPSPLRERALRLREEGLSYARVAGELGVSKTTARRLVDPGFAERMRVLSLAAKGRRTGVCESCGAVTRYGGHGGTVSRLCRVCANVENGLRRRGHGPVMDRVVELLASGERTRSEIRDRLGLGDDRMGLLLGRLVESGRVQRVGRGVYRKTA